MAATTTQRRPYGAGALFEKTDKRGRTSWYGQWRRDGVQIKRRIGPKRVNATSEGLTRRDAEAELRRLMREVKPVVPASEARTIAEVGKDYVVDLKRTGRKHSTLTAVESVLRVHLEPFFGNRVISSITHEEVVDLMYAMENEDLSPKTIRNYLGTLSALFTYAKAPRRRWATSNPCEGLELPRVPEDVEIHFLTVEQVERLVRSAQPGPFEAVDRAMYRTAAMTGIREGELIALRWMDVDWPARAIRVRRNYVLGEYGTPKSKRSSRSVPMADQVAMALIGHFEASGEPGDADLVFASPNGGGPLSKSGILRRMRASLKAAKLDDSRRFHDLRHTFGTQMAGKGTPMRTLQEWMGHRDIKTTERYADYAPKIADAQLVEAAFARSHTSTPEVSTPEAPLEAPS